MNGNAYKLYMPIGIFKMLITFICKISKINRLFFAKLLQSDRYGITIAKGLQPISITNLISTSWSIHILVFTSIPNLKFNRFICKIVRSRF